MNIIRRSQIVGLMTMDSSTATNYGTVEEIWVDASGRRVAYLASNQGYTPLEQVSVVGPDAVLTYSYAVFDSPTGLRPLNLLAVRSPRSEPLGWIEDFLFDWETGEIAAYILGGDIAAPFGGRAVLFPEDVEAIDAEVIILKEGARERLKHEQEGLKGFLSEKSQQVKTLVRRMGDRLQSLISPQDKPEVVRVKVKEVSDELAASGQHDTNALREATEFLEDQWESFQQRVNRAGERMKGALDATWKRLTRRK